MLSLLFLQYYCSINCVLLHRTGCIMLHFLQSKLLGACARSCIDLYIVDVQCWMCCCWWVACLYMPLLRMVMHHQPISKLSGRWLLGVGFYSDKHNTHWLVINRLNLGDQNHLNQRLDSDVFTRLPVTV